MRFPMNAYKGEGNSWGKLNKIASLVWVSSFQIANSLLAYVATFSGQLYFGRSYFFTLFQSNYFDTTVTFSGQLLLQNSCCFLLFQNSHFFTGVIFSEQLLFRGENSIEQPFLRIGSLQQLLFGTATFSEELFRIKISKKELLFQNRYFCTASTFSKKLYLGKKGFFTENLSINTMNKNSASNLLFEGSIDQNYLPKNMKNLSFWGA